MPGLNGSNLKTFTVKFDGGVPQTISLGSGLLFAYSIGGQSVEWYGSDYWSSKTELIFHGQNRLLTAISKSANSSEVSLTTSSTRSMRFLFLGE